MSRYKRKTSPWDALPDAVPVPMESNIILSPFFDAVVQNIIDVTGQSFASWAEEIHQEKKTIGEMSKDVFKQMQRVLPQMRGEALVMTIRCAFEKKRQEGPIDVVGFRETMEQLLRKRNFEKWINVEASDPKWNMNRKKSALESKQPKRVKGLPQPAQDKAAS